MPSLATTLVALSTLALSLSSPLHQRQTTTPTEVTLVALSDNSALQDQTINASSGGFYIGLPTAAYCPKPAPDCAAFSNTTIVTAANTTTIGTASLVVEVPGGQDVYVAEDGALSYTTAHEAGVFPPGSYPMGFAIVPSGDGGYEFIFEGFYSEGWIACPGAVEGSWQILAKVRSMGAVCAAAVDLKIAAVAASGVGAFEYD